MYLTQPLTKTDSTVALWQFNSESDTILDRSGAEHHGAHSGGTWLNECLRIIVAMASFKPTNNAMMATPPMAMGAMRNASPNLHWSKIAETSPVMLRVADRIGRGPALTASNPTAGDEFGISVSLFDNTAVVRRATMMASLGSLYYQHQPDGTWLEAQRISGGADILDGDNLDIPSPFRLA